MLFIPNKLTCNFHVSYNIVIHGTADVWALPKAPPAPGVPLHTQWIYITAEESWARKLKPFIKRTFPIFVPEGHIILIILGIEQTCPLLQGKHYLFKDKKK